MYFFLHSPMRGLKYFWLPLSNMLTSTQSRKRQRRAVMLEREPNFGKHRRGWDEGNSCRLEAKGGTMPALLHAQHQCSADCWGDGLQRGEQIGVHPAQVFQSFKQSFTGGYVGTAFSLCSAKCIWQSTGLLHRVPILGILKGLAVR